MSEARPAGPGDPFGEDVGERLWRCLAGAAVAVVPVAAGLSLWTTGALPFVLLGALVVYLLGVPVSWVLTRRGGRPVIRHAVAAAGVGVVVAGALAALSLPEEPLPWFAVYAIYAVGIGVPLAVLATGAGLALPARWLRPVAAVGLLVVALVLPVGTWWAGRPPAPYDFVVVREPELVREHATDAEGFAEVVAARFEQEAAEGAPRTAHATRVSVAVALSQGELDSVAAAQRLTLDEDLPTRADTGAPIRPVTVIFEGQDDQACVVVTPEASRVAPTACAELDLTG